MIREETRAQQLRSDLDLGSVPQEPARSGRTAVLERQIESLLRELEMTRARVEALEARIDFDPEVDVLSRTAFVRELGRSSIVLRSRPSHLGGAFLYLQLPDYGRINLASGCGAGQLVIREVVRLIKEVVRTDDIIGRLSPDEFGVVLHEASVTLASERAREIGRLVETKSISYLGEPLDVRVRTGVTRIRGFDTINDIICAAAFAARRDREGVSEGLVPERLISVAASSG